MPKKKTRKKTAILKQKKVTLSVPRWAVTLYFFLAVVLIPWVAYLSNSLPRRHITTHWDISWVGLDIGMIAIFFLTALLAYRRSRWATITATVSGSFLLLDAWFDVMSARPGLEFHEAILMACLIEIPLSVLSFSLAGHLLMVNIE
jgi:hypothetical protein